MDVLGLFNILKKEAAAIYTGETLLEKLMSNKKLRIKLGADPSRPDLHLGHSVVLRKLRLFQDLGHTVCFVIGDYTGMIGDPSGKNKTRPPLTFDQTRENGKSYYKQVTKILDKERTLIVYNSEWLSKMDFSAVLTLAGKYTLARIMERNDFADRYKNNQPVGLHELLYPLMQGYDSVALRADIEVGGTDQTYNMLVGRELQRCYIQEQQDVVTFPLLIGLDGIEKMSKSMDNYIGIDEPADIMFEKCMKVPDALLDDYFRLTTDVPDAIYKPAIKNDIYNAHLIFARETVRTYHGNETTDHAEDRYRAIASGHVPDAVDTITINSPDMSLTDLVISAGFCKTKSDARRLISQGGIRINGLTVTDVLLSVHDLNGKIISKGKNRYIKIRVGQ